MEKTVISQKHPVTRRRDKAFTVDWKLACLLLVRMSVLMLVLMLLAPVTLARAAPGAWVAQSPSLTVAGSERPSRGHVMQAPAQTPTEGRAMGRVHWRIKGLPATGVMSWLCSPEACAPIRASRGTTAAFAGIGAGTGLHFRFQLAAHESPIRLGGAKVIVHYH